MVSQFPLFVVVDDNAYVASGDYISLTLQLHVSQGSQDSWCAVELVREERRGSLPSLLSVGHQPLLSSPGGHPTQPSHRTSLTNLCNSRPERFSTKMREFLFL